MSYVLKNPKVLYRYQNGRLSQHDVTFPIQYEGNGMYSEKWDHVNTFYGFTTKKAAMREELRSLENVAKDCQKRAQKLRRKLKI